MSSVASAIRAWLVRSSLSKEKTHEPREYWKTDLRHHRSTHLSGCPVLHQMQRRAGGCVSARRRHRRAAARTDPLAGCPSPAGGLVLSHPHLAWIEHADLLDPVLRDCDPLLRRHLAA